MSGLKNVDDTSFEKEVLESEMPVLVDFSASWCGPCKRQLPIMEKFASDNTDKVKVVKVDIDDAPTFSNKFNIRGVPSIVLFHKGQVIDTKVGVTPTNVLNDLLKKI